MELDRRTFVRLLAASAAAPVAAASSTTEIYPQPHPAVNAGGPGPRNVVILICDDLGYGDLGCFGSSIKTPNLDKMAAAGRRCTHFNAAHPLCSASRAALLTGRYARRSGTKDVFFPHAKTGMSLQEVTLANLFQQAGFQTKAIGKWHLGDAPEYLPTNRGFDSFFGVPYSVDMSPLPLLRDLITLEADTDRELLTPRYTAEAVEFLERQSSKPFFLYLAYSYPHDPAAASPRFHGRSGLGDYGDAVEEIDWSIGEITKALERKGLLADTLILFMSDHGPWYQGNPGSRRGRKASTFEGGFRVPLFVRWDNVIPVGSLSEEWLSNLDILPTLISLCGLKGSPNPLDGIDISDALIHGNKPDKRKAILYFTPFSSGGFDLHCARKGPWKLRFAQADGEIYINDYTDGRQSFWLPKPELYNLPFDEGESYDVAKLHPQIVQEILDDVNAQVPTFPEKVSQSFDTLKKNVAASMTRPGAAPRSKSMSPVLEGVSIHTDRQ